MNFNHALTSQDGKLYIDGAVLEPAVETYSTYTDLPEGNYYLAEDCTLAVFMKIRGNVKLCLNGNTLDMGSERIVLEKTTNGTAMGNLSLCDCGDGDKITSSHSGGSSTDAAIEVWHEFSMYGGEIENTLDSTKSCNKAVSTIGGTVRLYGGEVVSLNDNAVYVYGNKGGYLSA